MGHRSGGILLLAAIAAAAAVATAQQRTIWDPLYTTAQAERGKAVYESFCAACHSEDLSGGGRYECVEAPPLKGLEEMEGRDFAGVFEWTKDHMPPGDPSSVSVDEKLDVFAYIFQKSGAPAGQAELTLKTDLRTIRITKKP
jgi:cytochrome c